MYTVRLKYLSHQITLLNYLNYSVNYTFIQTNRPNTINILSFVESNTNTINQVFTILLIFSIIGLND